jgi:hypothetical protein
MGRIRQKLIDSAQRPKTSERAKYGEEQYRDNWEKLCHINPRAVSLRFCRSSLTFHSTPIDKITADATQITSAARSEITLKISATETGPKTASKTPASRSASA